MKLHFFSLLIIFFALNGCIEKKDAMTNNTISEEASASDASNASKVKPLKIQMGYTNDKSDPLTIKNANIEGDILNVTVSYGGGCETHEMDLYFTGAYMKSMPPQATLFLKHNANGDKCRAIVQEDLQFDLSEIKKTQNHVIFRIDGYKEKLEYKNK